jgi:hypothetical protein
VPGVCAAEKWRAVERERERERGERKEKREGERLTDRDKSERDSWESQRQRERETERERDRERRVPIMPRTLRTVHVYMSTYSMCHIPMQYIFQIYVCSGSLNPKP